MCAKHQPQQVRRGCEPEILLRLAFSTVALADNSRMHRSRDPCSRSQGPFKDSRNETKSANCRTESVLCKPSGMRETWLVVRVWMAFFGML